MDTTRFDNLTRSVSFGGSRRGVLGKLAAVALGLAATRVPIATVARKRGKNKPLQMNAFGCLDVGKACRGNGGHCCSGICEGTKPRKGKKDRSHCVAHNVLGCQASQDQCAGAPVSCGTSTMGLCYRTTGAAGYCGVAGGCLECKSDADCVAHGGFGEGAACVVCLSCPQTTACFAAAP